MHGAAQPEMPPYAGYPSISPFCTSGLAMSMPMPPGTTIGLPFSNQSRCECTWYCKRSAVSGTSPAFTVNSIAFAGAGYGMLASPAGGFGDEPLLDDEHAPSTATSNRSAHALTTKRFTPKC